MPNALLPTSAPFHPRLASTAPCVLPQRRRGPDAPLGLGRLLEGLFLTAWLLPHRGGSHILVLCTTFKAPCAEDAVSSPQLHPHPTNNRAPCDRTMRAAATSQPVFSCQQQYTLLEPSTHWPIGEPPTQPLSPLTMLRMMTCMHIAVFRMPTARLGDNIHKSFLSRHCRFCCCGDCRRLA